MSWQKGQKLGSLYSLTLAVMQGSSYFANVDYGTIIIVVTVLSYPNSYTTWAFKEGVNE